MAKGAVSTKKPPKTKCSECGLTGKHKPECSQSLQSETKAACAHKSLKPSGLDTWVCTDCGDTITVKGTMVSDSSGRDMRATHPAEALRVDGTTGGARGSEVKRPADNGAPATHRQPEQIELVKPSNDDIIHSVTLKQAEINVAKSEAGRARKRVKDLLDQREQMINELIGRDALKYNIQLDLGGDDDEDDE
jgi:hypothetical protein